MRRYLLATLLASGLVLVPGCGSGTGSTSVTVLGYSVVIKTSPPATTEAGSSIPVAFTVTENESDGSSKPASGVSFTVTITAGGGTINGSGAATLATAADGSVSVTWILGSSVGTQTVRGSVLAGGYLDVNVAATTPTAAQLAFASTPSTTTVGGIVLALQPVVQLKSASGIAVALAGVPVTASLTGSGTLVGGPLTAITDANGRATFTGLTITALPGGKILQFTATLNGLVVTLTAPVTVVPGPPTQLVLSTMPSVAAQSGVVLAQQPAVQIEDAAGNAVSLAGVTVTVTIDVGGGALTGSLGVYSSDSGLATFIGLAITGSTGSRTLKFSAVINGNTLTVSSAQIAIGP